MSLVNLNLGLQWSRGYSFGSEVAVARARFSEDKTNLALAPSEWIPVATEKNQRGFTTTNDRLRCRQTERTWGWLGSSD